MQRPANFGTRNVLTEEEFAQREAQAKRTAEADSEEFAKQGATVGINPPSHWIDRGKPNRQASLVVDPPDGRVPPLTPEAQQRVADRQAEDQGRGPADSWKTEASTNGASREASLDCCRSYTTTERRSFKDPDTWHSITR